MVCMMKIMSLWRSMIYMNNEESVQFEIEIDKTKVAKLIGAIIISESNNIKSGEKSDTQMIKEIKKKIEEEVNCY